MIPIDPEGFRRGDGVVFRQIVEGYSPRLLAIARSFAADDDEAKDLLQDVWTRAYAKRASFDGRGSLLGWLLSITRSVCLSARRRRHPSPALVAAGTEPAHTPLRALERREAAEHVRSALLTLTDRQRDVVVLRLLEGRSTRETALELRIAEGTVKATLHQALAALRKGLHEEPK